MDLPETIRNIRSRLDAINSFPARGDLSTDEWLDLTTAWRDQVRQLGRDLQSDLGARIVERPAQGATVTLAGIRASSTSGLTSALRNWIAAAEKRLAQGVAA